VCNGFREHTAFISEPGRINMRGKGTYLKPWLFGIICGTLFVLAEAFLDFYPPAAYSFCLTCHTRDLVNTATNLIFSTNYQTAFLARRILMITSPAVLLGAFIAARISGEYIIQKKTRPVLFFIAGFFIMITGIVIFGCPTRIVIRAGYGDIYGIAAVGGMCVGIYIGTKIVKYFAARMFR
jgi:hypothetical protein